ncbi:MAG: metallopeptidase TldD-related protein, partial [Thermodesulfobacteriota bacterium]|nr:metallopeptidase TldD-related protein [Thermodesulfobacteriota bacterium]
EMLGARKSGNMKCPVVLDNLVASEFLMILGSLFLSENVAKGKSLFAEKIGQEVASPLLSIIDDGVYEKGVRASPFDGEGTVRRKNVLVSSGILKGYLYDRLWGMKLGEKSTGNAHRSTIKSPPKVGITNLMIEPGMVSPDEIIKSIDRGIILKDVMGIHTANPISGDFSVGAAGLLVEKGEVQYPVSGFALSGNIIDLYKGVRAVGNDLKLYGNVGSPTLLIEMAEISGS